MISYELAKQLKEAGFPQKGEGSIGWTDQEPDLGTPVYCPKLSELIEACGEGFGLLYHDDTGWNAWSSDFSFESENALIQVDGSTPEEAVARLWLELNKKK